MRHSITRGGRLADTQTDLFRDHRAFQRRREAGIFRLLGRKHPFYSIVWKPARKAFYGTANSAETCGSIVARRIAITALRFGGNQRRGFRFYSSLYRKWMGIRVRGTIFQQPLHLPPIGPTIEVLLPAHGRRRQAVLDQH